MSNRSATAFWIESMVILRSCTCTRCFSTCCAICSVIGVPGQRGIGDQLDQRAFQFAHVRLGLGRHEGPHVVRQLDAFRFGLLVQDGHLGLEIGRLDVGHQSPFEARAQTLHQAGNVLRRRIARDHDLLLVVVQFVEGVEELFLCAFLVARATGCRRSAARRPRGSAGETAACARSGCRRSSRS